MADFAAFRTDFAPRDEGMAAALMAKAALAPEAEQRIDVSASGMIEAIRLEDFGFRRGRGTVDGNIRFRRRKVWR